uniref:Uncharacterized protein n=1 Tax=Aegilops tauschii subsp. strangulata TaxID=200361 RepID=A0A453DCZ9_AEGTS
LEPIHSRADSLNKSKMEPSAQPLQQYEWIT